jgi:plasmid maintenance system antidote protein VapI
MRESPYLFITTRRRQQLISEERLAEYLRMTVQELRTFLAEEMPISDDLAARLSSLLGNTPGFWAGWASSYAAHRDARRNTRRLYRIKTLPRGLGTEEDPLIWSLTARNDVFWPIEQMYRASELIHVRLAFDILQLDTTLLFAALGVIMACEKKIQFENEYWDADRWVKILRAAEQADRTVPSTGDDHTPGRLHCCWVALCMEIELHELGDDGPLHRLYAADPEGAWPPANLRFK